MTLSSELCRTQHGKAQTAKSATYVGSGCCRTYLGGGVWVARCKFRDTDGTTRRVERRGPFDAFDKQSKLAEQAVKKIFNGGECEFLVKLRKRVRGTDVLGD